MADSDKTTGVIALIVLLFAAGAATRGYLPGTAPEPRGPAEAGKTELILLAVLLVISAGTIAAAIVYRMRHRRAVPGSMGRLPATAGPQLGRPTWRVLIGLVAVALSLVGIFALATVGITRHFAVPAELSESHGGAPASQSAPDTLVPVSPPQPPQSRDRSAGHRAGQLLVLTAGMLVVFTAVAVAARAGPAEPAPDETGVGPVAAPAPTAGETLAGAAELGLTRIADRSRGPREAIIACYAVMERQLADVPDAAPREFDTPTEVLVRAVQHHALPADNAARLVELFTEARFSPHQMTEEHRADAVGVLRLVLDELRAAT